ncbi:hypothetical protein C2G38_2002524 [Gigaspora rosea]|uniref:Cation-transporting P-type ATPase C-terminal domain-containing protein n=1 Tax=Gigaspora rosea TaxID=44941 RepID=A0A397V0J8_9GLOM|nr:hypothetical protein C2G38_2002524 [Gigaspora rosea]
MGLVVQEDSCFRFYVKGVSEVLLQKSRYIVDTKSDNKIELTDHKKDATRQIIECYASQDLRTLAIAYRDLDQWPPNGIILDPDGEVRFEDLMMDITLLCIVGIEYPLREGVRQAVMDCKEAGVKARTVTGDNVLTAKSIAEQCDIYTGGIVMEGPEVRYVRFVSPRIEYLPQLQDIARYKYSLEDKKTLVGKLTTKKLLQFQLTVNVTAVLLTFISVAVSGDQQKSVLTAVQLLWVNLIMGTLAALSLATDPPTPDLLKRKPENRKTPLITPQMWKMIIGQSIFQLAIILILNLLYAADDVGHGLISL